MTREFRSIHASFRTEQSESGKQYLVGFAATYNTLSEILADNGGSFRERIMPGAFSRAIREKQDVRHLINHSADLVLGRTKAGTTELTDTAKGLRFKTLLPETGYARDLAASVARGDIDSCSFGFSVHYPKGERWVRENSEEVRELLDVDLFDISTVTFPAYPQTSAELSSRSFPDGLPAEIRSHITGRVPSADEWRRRAQTWLRSQDEWAERSRERLERALMETGLGKRFHGRW